MTAIVSRAAATTFKPAYQQDHVALGRLQTAAGPAVIEADDAETEQELTNTLSRNEERVAQQQIRGADGDEEHRVLSPEQHDAGGYQ